MQEDVYTEVTRRGWLARLGGSLGGALAGILLFLGAFGVLYWNEGRQDLSAVARGAGVIDAAAPARTKPGALVAATGRLETDERLGDAHFRPGAYLRLEREAQMFAWEERTERETREEAGGSETTVTTYRYRSEWTTQPDRSSSFKRPAGHHNPPMRVKRASLRPEALRLGVLRLRGEGLDLPAAKPVALASRDTKGGRRYGEWLYLGDASPSRPRIGDMRLRYRALPSGERLTVFGQLEAGNRLVPYVRGGDTLYRAFRGDHRAAVEALRGEHSMATWGLRLLGFAMMWGGLALLLEPFAKALSVLPLLGRLGRGLAKGLAFVVALGLTTLTVLVSKVLHSPLLLVAFAVAVIAAGVAVRRRKPSEASARRAA